MRNPFKQMRDRAISEQLKIALSNKLQQKHNVDINSSATPEAMKLHFHIRGKDNTEHEFVWPRQGVINKKIANGIVKDIDEMEIDNKYNISFIWLSDLPTTKN